MKTWKIMVGDARACLGRVPDESVQTCITSPPYWGLRDYGLGPSVWGGDPERECDHVFEVRDGQHWCVACDAWEGCLGLEPTPELYVQHIVEVFREVRRTLRPDGTLWLNLGDTYITNPRGKGGQSTKSSRLTNPDRQERVPRAHRGDGRVGESACPSGAGANRRRPQVTIDPKYPQGRKRDWDRVNRNAPGELKHKDMVGIPWMVAFALRADGWYLRADIIWHKTSPMPESIRDRPTRAHEYVFLLAKNRRYFYDYEAVREPCVYGDHPRNGNPELEDIRAPGQAKQSGLTKRRRSGNKERKKRSDYGGVDDSRARQAFGVPWDDEDGKRNKRSVWTVGPEPLHDDHFASYPTKLIDPCVLAGAPVGGLVLDPFAGSGTTGIVSLRHGRRFLGVELNPRYAQLARRRIRDDVPVVNTVLEAPADPALHLVPKQRLEPEQLAFFLAGESAA